MKIINCRLMGQEGLTDILIDDGVFQRIAPGLSQADAETIDAAGRLVTPPFVEPHIHLDAALTAGDPEWNASGTLFEGIALWARRKETLSGEDVMKRAEATVEMCAKRGIQFIRTHVDVTDPALTALKAMLKVRARVADLCEMQIVAFPQDGILSFPNGRELMREAAALGADVLGAIPHGEFMRDYGVESIRFVMELAERNGLRVDIHCDEIDDEQSRFLEVAAAEAIRLGNGARVTASHTCAMGSYNDAYAYKLMGVLNKAGINFVSCPTESIHLQGRLDTYPKRRGLTRVKELLAAGLNVCFAQDSIIDPWYPLGNGHILNVLFHGLHITQLTGRGEIDRSLELITVNGAKTLGLQDRYGLEIGKPASLLILDAETVYDAVRTQAEVLYSIRNGRIIAQSEPARRTLFRPALEPVGK
ncbi:cytosine deaminase [Deltaproteobacteria bacterium OttesenSCG-928-M10]|nr:cytosine deaminase [Deltaproteobacteria bacterium OttesenSCG-928-M10]